MPVPQQHDLKPPDLTRARQEAARLHAQGGVSEPPVDPVALARALGHKVYFATFAEAGRSVSGFFDSDEDAAGAIIVNRDEAPLAKTFIIAHELGHAILHPAWVRSPDYRILRRDRAPPPDDPREQEAAAFAQSLLVPRALIERYRPGRSPETLSRLFAVSVTTIQNRLAADDGER